MKKIAPLSPPAQQRRNPSRAGEIERLLGRLTTALILREADDPMFIFPAKVIAQLWDAVQVDESATAHEPPAAVAHFAS
jgi:hypothetical protein